MATPLKTAKNALLAEFLQRPGVRDCLAWFTKERQWINEQHVQLCRVPAATFLEQKRAEWMVERFRSLGYEAYIDRGGNVVAHFSAAHNSAAHNGAAQFDTNSKQPYIAVTAHLDTVLAPRNW